MTKTNFDNQKIDATAAARFASILSDNGKTAVVLVPGHDAKQYKIILRRDGGVMTAECLLSTSIGDKPCVSGERLCYHSIAAMIAVARIGKTTLSFSKSADSAHRLTRIAKNTARVVVLARHNYVSSNIFVTARKVTK